LVFGVVVASVAFALMWRKGYFLKISNYVQETKEELRKCSWPTREELIESTAVVMVAILLLGAFTVGADFIISLFVHLIA
jgi:preprotein translocase subunit SecE